MSQIHVQQNCLNITKNLFRRNLTLSRIITLITSEYGLYSLLQLPQFQNPNTHTWVIHYQILPSEIGKRLLPTWISSEKLFMSNCVWSRWLAAMCAQWLHLTLATHSGAVNWSKQSSNVHPSICKKFHLHHQMIPRPSWDSSLTQKRHQACGRMMLTMLPSACRRGKSGRSLKNWNWVENCVTQRKISKCSCLLQNLSSEEISSTLQHPVS